jgi:hypothetical protein
VPSFLYSFAKAVNTIIDIIRFKLFKQLLRGGIGYHLALRVAHPLKPASRAINEKKGAFRNGTPLFSAEAAAKLTASVFLAELIYTTCGIKNLLLTGKEGVAGGTDIKAQITTHGRFGLEGITAATGRSNLIIFRVNLRFHG